MARRVFFSFHYDDIMNANIVRMSGQFKPTADTGFYDASLWESAKTQGDAAIRTLEAAVSTDTDDHRSYFALAVAYEKVGDLQDAITNYERAFFLAKDERYDQGATRAKAKEARTSRDEEPIGASDNDGAAEG